MKSSIIRVALVGALITLGACAQGARSTAMVAPVTDATIVSQSNVLREALSVGAVAGGSDTSALLASQISNGDFRTALQQSLSLATLEGGTDAPLIVDANILNVEQPVFGISMTVTTKVRYEVRSISGATVHVEEVTTPYTASFSDSALGAERLRLANEGSAKANISSFIEKLVAASEAEPAKFSAGVPTS